MTLSFDIVEFLLLGPSLHEFPPWCGPKANTPHFTSFYPASGFDEIKGRFIKSYNGDNEFSHALQVFKLPHNYFKVVMDYLPTIASTYKPKWKWQKEDEKKDNEDNLCDNIFE